MALRRSRVARLVKARTTYVDAALSIALLVIGVIWLGAAAPGATAEHGPSLLGVALVVLQALPLAARRRAPLAVLVAVMTGAALYGAFTFPPSPIDLAELLALYTVAAYRPPRALALGGAVVLASLGVTWATSPLWYGGGLELAAVALLFGLVAAGGIHQRSRLKLLALEAEHAAELGQARADRAVAEERVALARELHDAVGHAQTVVLFHAGVARMTFDSDPGRSRQALDVVEDRSRATLEEMQLLVDSLRNQGEGTRPPLPTLADLGALIDVARQADLELTLTTEGAARQLPAAVEVTAYRIIQEALTNVVRHAQAREVRLTLRYGDQELGIAVRDDGVGAASPAGWRSTGPGRQRSQAQQNPPAEGRKGILGMKERASSMGGRFEAGPCADGGFLVAAWLPCPVPTFATEPPGPGSDPAEAPRLVKATAELAQRGSAG